MLKMSGDFPFTVLHLNQYKMKNWSKNDSNKRNTTYISSTFISAQIVHIKQEVSIRDPRPIWLELSQVRLFRV